MNTAFAQKPALQKWARETLTVDLVVMMNPRTGGLDGDDRVGPELQSSGFYVDLKPWAYHVFKVSIWT
ncbi:MAG TPA: hypothetical protein VLA60_04350 [Nitrospirales bacterium]|nr:hypothetical protein [Nitrospirales bacterium]